MRICIRCDGSKALGIGDLAFGRDVALELSGRGAQATLLTRDLPVARDCLAGFPDVAWLPAALSLDEELALVPALGRKLGMTHLLVVRFDVRPQVYLPLAGPALACVDFSREPLCGFDLVIDWEFGNRRAAPPVGQPGPILLSGPGYAPLRQSVRAALPLAAPPGAEVGRILVTMGGTDVANLTVMALQAAKEAFPKAAVHVIAGPGCDRAEVEAAASGGRAVVWTNVAETGPHLARADVVVTAGGLTLFEALGLNRPCLCLPAVEHQRRRCEGLHAAGAAVTVDPVGGREALVLGLRTLAPMATRRNLSRRASEVVGLDGLSRIADALIDLPAQKRG